MLKLYENIRLYRKRAKMTQDELARLAGYTDRSSIAKIEKGLVDLAQSKIEQFASIFGVSAGELMGWDQVPAEELQDMGALAAQVIMDLDAMEMMRKYMCLGESDRHTVRVLVDTLAEKTKKD
jgi:transcriptional regulator with XRE-family HTH domain